MIDVNTIQQKAEVDRVSSSLVFKEHVHIIILEYLFRKGLFTQMVFQGGTALRLVYQGVRYSEDLDFVLQKTGLRCFENMGAELKSLTSHIKKMIPFVKSAQLKIQKGTSIFKRYCLMLESDFLSAKDKTNIEIANIPSHKHHTVFIQHPRVRLSPAITVEAPEEIFSDKLLAFIARDYIKGRDLWDIYFLMHTIKISLNKEIVGMVEKKISDYKLNNKDIFLLFTEKKQLFKKEGVRLLHDEMDRFLPAAYREAFKDRYSHICSEELELFEELSERLKK